MKERILLVHNAAKAMPFARRAYANTLKVIILIAVFWSILYLPSVGLKVLAILFAGLLYPIVLFPVTLNLAAPYLPEAIRRYKTSGEIARDEPGTGDLSDSEDD